MANHYKPKTPVTVREMFKFIEYFELTLDSIIIDREELVYCISDKDGWKIALYSDKENYLFINECRGDPPKVLAEWYDSSEQDNYINPEDDPNYLQKKEENDTIVCINEKGEM